MRGQARWYVRGEHSGEVFEVVRLTYPSKGEVTSTVLVRAAGIRGTAWRVPARDLIRS